MKTFSITVPPESRTLYADADGRAEVAYTITNQLTAPARGRLQIVPRGSALEKWFALDGEPERDFRAGEAHLATVRVRIPADVPAGKFDFRADAISVVNPQEDFSEGDLITIEWRPRPPVPPPKFPWWLWLVLGGIAIVILGVLIWRFWPEPAVVSEPPPPPPTRIVRVPSESPVDFSMSTKQFEFSADDEWLIIAAHNDVVLHRAGQESAENDPDQFSASSIDNGVLVPSRVSNLLLVTDSSSEAELWAVSADRHGIAIGEFDEGASRSFEDADFSEDGKRLALVVTEDGDELPDGTVPDRGSVLFCTVSGQLAGAVIGKWATNGPATFVRFSPDSTRLVTAGSGFPPQVWAVGEISESTPPAPLTLSSADTDWSQTEVQGITFNADGTMLITATMPTPPEAPLEGAPLSTVSLRIWNTATGAPVSGNIRSEWVEDIYDEPRSIISPDGRWAVGFDVNGQPVLWDLLKQPAPQPHRLSLGAASGFSAAFDRKGELLAIGARNGVWYYDLLAKDPFTSPIQQRPTDLPVTLLRFSPGGKWLAAQCDFVPSGDDSVDLVSEPVIRLWPLVDAAVEIETE